MICQKCKNPIADNATFCEWCGAVCLNQKSQKIAPKTNEPSDATVGCLFLLALFSIGLAIGGIVMIFTNNGYVEQATGGIVMSIVGILILVPLIRWFSKWFKK